MKGTHTQSITRHTGGGHQYHFGPSPSVRKSPSTSTTTRGPDSRSRNAPFDRDAYEPSPSAGPEETAIVMDARDGYDHEPPADDDADPEPLTLDAVPPADRPTHREVSA